ncbi:hypothetical protein HD806DRAFT_543313 [Xylariaceae sp. AK1471]|nr:hypothetical protein HD806DRAFT_543313 [Xylariaceae sp. AK1471]
MGDNAPASDKSLIERLNALKPSSVSLISPPSSKSDLASAIERANPPSREDALTARLKTLRNRESGSVVSTPQLEAHQDHGAEQFTQPLSAGETKSLTGYSLGTDQVSAPIQPTDNIDPLLYTDDQTLEELLEELRSDETWLEDVAAEEEEHQRVTALLTELSMSSGAKVDTDGQSADQDAAQEEDGEGSDDDSEGQVMAAEADSVLAKAVDEVEWEKTNKSPSPPPQPISKPLFAPGNAELSSQDGTSHGRENNQKSPTDNPFNLPTVPSELQDQPDLPPSSAQTQSDVDFAASIASRMAALKLSGPRTLPSAPNAAIDSLGLPLAPTFAPADRPVPGLAKRTGLTDEDEKTWCVVCLDDGTVHCLGCEAGDDVYCARCWKEMHVGPQAGYDERGHSWETFIGTIGSRTQLVVSSHEEVTDDDKKLSNCGYKFANPSQGDAHCSFFQRMSGFPIGYTFTSQLPSVLLFLSSSTLIVTELTILRTGKYKFTYVFSHDYRTTTPRLPHDYLPTSRKPSALAPVKDARSSTVRRPPQAGWCASESDTLSIPGPRTTEDFLRDLLIEEMEKINYAYDDTNRTTMWRVRRKAVPRDIDVLQILMDEGVMKQEDGSLRGEEDSEDEWDTEEEDDEEWEDEEWEDEEWEDEEWEDEE